MKTSTTHKRSRNCPAICRFLLSCLCAMTISDTLGQTPQSAVSRKTHGAAGNFDLDLPLGGTPGIECRNGGATNDYQVIVNFSGPVSVNGNPQAAVTAGSGIVGSGGVSNGGMVTTSGNSVTVPLTNIANAQTIFITLFAAGNAGDVVIPMGLLMGDTNGTGAVNASDVIQTKAELGQPVSQTNFRADVNGNGAINASDVSMVKPLAGTGLPPWLPDLRLTFNSAFSSTSFNNARCIAAGPPGPDGDVLHLVFFDERDGNREIYYKRSTNGGTSWQPEVRLTSNSAISHFPAMAVSGSVLHVVWEEYRDEIGRAHV